MSFVPTTRTGHVGNVPDINYAFRIGAVFSKLRVNNYDLPFSVAVIMHVPVLMFAYTRLVKFVNDLIFVGYYSGIFYVIRKK